MDRLAVMLALRNVLQLIEVVARIVDILGISIIFWGIGVGLVAFVSGQLPRNRETDSFHAIARIRCKVGSYMLLGLEILIGSDIAQTVIEPTYERVGVLGAIVVIRTILSFFLTRELEAIANKELQERSK